MKGKETGDCYEFIAGMERGSILAGYEQEGRPALLGQVFCCREGDL